MSEHTWVQENLDAYVADALPMPERNRVERHLSTCSECAHIKSDISETDQLVASLFAPVRPDVGLEDRAIQKLRQKARPRPTWLRFIAAAAAVIVFGLIGGVVQMLAFDGTLALPGMDRKPEAEQARAPRTYFGMLQGRINHGQNYRFGETQPEDKVGLGTGTMAGHEGKESLDRDRLATTYYKRQQDDIVKARKMTEEAGYDEKKKDESRADNKELDKYKELPPGGVPPPGSGLNSPPKDDTGKEGKVNFPTPATTTFFDSAKNNQTETTATERRTRFFPPDGKDKAPDRLEQEIENTLKMKMTLKPSEDQKDVLAKMLHTMKDAQQKEAGDKTTKGDPKLDGGGGGNEKGLIPPPYPEGPKTPIPSIQPASGMPPGGQPPGKELVPLPPVPVKPGDDYFKPMTPPPVEVGENKKDPNSSGKEGGKGEGDGDGKQGEPKKGKAPPKTETPKAEQKPKVEAPPEDTNRKIIRTGEIEFEVESFYTEMKDGKVVKQGAVDTITTLITKVQGGFISSSNSEKLPNGKMKGSIVVRMPPQHLDKFVLDLRAELTKKGIHKHERIVSHDITKQYTDIESRLRAARAIEDRLINIIKTGKGEIKDLVAAEKELGLWRTKIEEMEGEIRYYGNQVALSTLTITLAEQELQAPTSLIMSESVKMRVEVDDVADAHDKAMAAVKNLKGTLNRSELKQHPAGQLVSIIQADIPPDKRDQFFEIVKKLGILSDHQKSQFQHTEGGSGKPGGLEAKKGDVRFDITMFDTVNIRPRLTADWKVATTDVVAKYEKILDTVKKEFKGQIRDAQLNEQDKLNVNATIDFNVPKDAKKAVEDLLESMGTVLEKATTRAPFSELSTESKVGYRVTLRDFTAIPPKQTVVNVIAVRDVALAFAKLEAIARSKGQVSDAKLNDQDKNNVNAHLEFTVPTEAKADIEKELAEFEKAGDRVSRTNMTAPINMLTTPKKLGFAITLRDFTSIPARQSVVNVIAVRDVALEFAKLEAIARAKGQVSDATLNEQDKNNVNAYLYFTVPTEMKGAIETELEKLEKIGDRMSRTNVTQPVQVLATTKKFGYTITLRDFASIPPSKAVVLTAATYKVPAAYEELLTKITHKDVAGTVVDANLNEQDRFNIHARIDFFVPTDKKQAIDDLLKDILSRTNIQTPSNQFSLAKKFGYTVFLKDFANVLPSHAANVTLAANDVPGSFAELITAIKDANGQMSAANLDEQDKLNITALLKFTVPEKEKGKFDTLLAKLGTQLSRKNEQAPNNAGTTDKKFGYTVDLRDFTKIQARETFHVQVATVDVLTSFKALQDAVAAAKGLVSVGQIREETRDKIEATFAFDVPASERQPIEKLLKKVGAELSRTSSQIPVDQLATEKKVGYRLTLRATAGIPPRETVSVRLDVAQVEERAIELRDIVAAAKGRVIQSAIEDQENGQRAAVLKFEVPYASQETVLRQFRGTDKFASRKSVPNPSVAENELTTSHIYVTLTGSQPIVDANEGLWSYVRTSLGMSFKIIAVCLMFIIIGVSAVLPWALVVWVLYKVYMRMSGGGMQLAPATGLPPHGPAATPAS